MLVTLSQILVGDQIIINGENYMIMYINKKFCIVQKEKTKEITSLYLNEVAYELKGHVTQQNDFIDKKWKVLRTNSIFIDPDNNDKEENWKLGIVCFDKDWEEQVSYTQEEFKTDCEIIDTKDKEIERLIELEKEANSILEKVGWQKVSLLDKLFGKK